jgi:hypothetical protein
MDWITILLVFLFFVLPLIQEVAKRGKGPPGPVEPHDYGEDAWEEEEELEEAPPAGERTQREDDSAWDALGLEGIFTGKTPTPPPPPPDREPVEPARSREPEPAVARRAERAEPVLARTPPEPEEDAHLERLRAYERKVRDATRRPVPEAMPVPGFTRTARAARMAGEISTLGEVEHRGSKRAARLRALLDDPDAFEDAFMLRQVLGPPRALEPYS